MITGEDRKLRKKEINCFLLPLQVIWIIERSINNFAVKTGSILLFFDLNGVRKLIDGEEKVYYSEK
jgi:hypothetical protein